MYESGCNLQAPDDSRPPIRPSICTPTHPEIALRRVRSDCRAEIQREKARAAAQEAKLNARIEHLEGLTLVMATAPKEMLNTPFGGSNSTTMSLLLYAVETGLPNAVDALLAMSKVQAVTMPPRGVHVCALQKSFRRMLKTTQSDRLPSI